MDFGVALPFYKHYARASNSYSLPAPYPFSAHAPKTRATHDTHLPHFANNIVNQHEGPHRRARRGPLQVSLRGGAITRERLLTAQQRLGQRRNNWWSHRNNSWRCRSLCCKQKIPFIQSSHAALPCFPRHLDRNIHRYAILDASSAVTPTIEHTADCVLAVIAADRASAKYDIEHTPEKQAQIKRDREREALLEQNKTAVQRAKEWATDNRYPLLFGFWIASMAGSWHLVNRNRYLSGSQKLVTARMYAQGLTLTALLTSFAFEGSDAAKGKGRWETIKVIDPNDPEHKNVIEKRIHHERYAGEDQWRGTFHPRFWFCCMVKGDTILLMQHFSEEALLTCIYRDGRG